MKKDTSWNNVASWYDKTINDPDSYQNKVISPNLLRLLGLQKSDKIIDVACGTGFFAKEYLKYGGEIFGSDIAQSLIEIAKRECKKAELFVSSSNDLFFAKSEYFDKATIILALQNIEDLNGTFFEVARVLRTGGSFVFVLNHPAFRIPKWSDWGFDEERDIQYRRIDKYLSESREEIEMNPGRNKSEKTLSFNRPLQVYFKALEKAGFMVERLEEWTSHKKSEEGPRKISEDRARKEIPLFLTIVAKKV